MNWTHITRGIGIDGGRPVTRDAIRIALLAILLCSVFAIHRADTALAAPLSFPVSYTGTDYIQPSEVYTGCQEWTWLQATCYTNAGKTSYGVSPQRQLASDLAFISSQHLGGFQRVFISLDQLFSCWDATTGYCGYDPQALANVADMLHTFARYGIKTDLVLYGWGSNAASYVTNMFRPMALDGLHPQMRAGYLGAIHDFVTYLAGDATAASAVAVMDLQNEAYYQLETYFGAGTTNPANLGAWKGPENAPDCDTLGNTDCTGCITDSGHVDNQCVDVNIGYPWVRDVYNAAKVAAPNFLYTVSDTRRLVATDSNFQNFWIGMYPVDVYDIHAYNDAPWTDAARWASALKLAKPWFVGEAGCSNSDGACTYNGTNALPVDSWWLDNLRNDGASAVLIESQSTAWNTPGPNNYALTPTGQQLQTISGAAFVQDFDGQGAGALLAGPGTNVLGPGVNQFSGVANAGRLAVETSVASSNPNGLAVTLNGGGSAYLSKQYLAGTLHHTLVFRIQLGSDIVLPSYAYLVLAQTLPTYPPTSSAGKVTLVLSGNKLLLDYVDSSGGQHYLYSNTALSSGIWYTVGLTEVVGAGTGMLTLMVDGKQVISVAGLDTGQQPVGYVAVGDEYTPPDAGTAGHIYLDDVQTSAS